MEITSFGVTNKGENVDKITLDDGCGNILSLINFGASIQSLFIDGVDVALGYETVKEYEENSGCLGAVIGRSANRIDKGEFLLNGEKIKLSLNKPTFHTHGGFEGFDKKVWKYVVSDDNHVTFTLESPDGDEGYPGNAKVSVTYTFKYGKLGLHYDAVADKDTIFNLTNHCYFNLNGKGEILNHLLQMNANEVAVSNPLAIPSDERVEVTGTPFDFRTEKAIGQDIGSDYPLVKQFNGYDHNILFETSTIVRPVARLYSPETKISMAIATDMDTMCLYTGNSLKGQKGKNGLIYGVHTGVCFETQYMTNSVNLKTHRKPIFKAGEHYTQTTFFTFTKH